jgi:hypothetical protein
VEAVHFGAVSVPFTVDSEHLLVATSPAWTVEILNVRVTTPYGTSVDVYCHPHRQCSVRDGFRVVEPTITGLSPDNGPVAGGTPVTVTGTGFAVGDTRTSFVIGKTEATDVECSSMTTCKLLTSPGRRGAQFSRVKVESSDPGLQQSPPKDPASTFTYE